MLTRLSMYDRYQGCVNFIARHIIILADLFCEDQLWKLIIALEKKKFHILIRLWKYLDAPPRRAVQPIRTHHLDLVPVLSSAPVPVTAAWYRGVEGEMIL